MITEKEFKRLYVQSNIAVHCPTYEIAKQFLTLADAYGYQWADGHKYPGREQYEQYGNKTCYWIYKGQFGNLDFARSHDYKIVKLDNTTDLLPDTRSFIIIDGKQEWV